MEFRLQDLVDIPVLQRLTDELFKVTGIPSGIIAKDGAILTISGCQRIRMEFLGANPLIHRDDIDSDTCICTSPAMGDSFTKHVCPRGLVDASYPIIIEGKHIASVFSGQFFANPPMTEQELSFREQAKQYGLDEEDFMAAYHGIPVIPESAFHPAIAFIAKLAELLAGIKLSRFRESVVMEELRVSESRYKRLLESTRTVYWEADLATGCFTHMDPQAGAVLGYPSEFWRDMNAWAMVLHEDDRSKAMEYQLSQVSQGRDHEFEFRLRTPEGRIIWIQEVVSVTHGSNGPERLAGFMRDITSRKQAEVRLRESEERYQQLTRAVIDYIYTVRIVDGQAVETSHGTGCYAVTGYTSEEFAMDPYLWIRIVHQDDRPAVQSHASHILLGKQSTPMEHRIVRRDGEIRWVRNTSVSHKDASGGLVSYDGLITDITERKNVELALRESEERYRVLIEASPASIMVVQDGRYVFANPAGARQMGYDHPARLQGVDALDAVAPESRDAVKDRMGSIQSNKHSDSMELAIIRPDGVLSYSETTSVPVEYDGRPAALVIGLDITERKRAEEERTRLQEELQQAQKMESVGRLAGGVAHDSNNMLQTILGYADMALEEVEPGSSLYAHLIEIQRAAERSAGLTRQLLAFARKQTFSPHSLDLNDVVSGMLNMLGRLIGEDVRLVWKPGAKLWPVRMDPSQVDQILANLAVNARDAIGGVGCITIETSNAVIKDPAEPSASDIPPGDYILLLFRDTGKGMDAGTRAHLFEPFFTTKAVGEGTGLGLATVYGIIKQNDGFITIDSAPGEGATFKIYLRRIATSPEGAKAATKPRSLPGGDETILLVEDEASVLRLGRAILERLGYKVHAVRSAKEAMRIAGNPQIHIDLLVTDVIMPDMNGNDLALALAALQPSVKHLFMSGYTANIIARHGVLDSGIHFIQKPFQALDLANKVREALGGFAQGCDHDGTA